MPLNFAKFWKLIWTRKKTDLLNLKNLSQKAPNHYMSMPSESDQTMLEVYKWKLNFDSYRDKLPQYYNDYLNSYLKFL